MSYERLQDQSLTEALFRFTRLDNEHGVNNWLLKGESGEGGMPDVYTGCFPKLYAPTGSLVVVLPVRPDIEGRLSEYYKQILTLTVPENAAKIDDDQNIRDGIETIVTRGGLPSFVLVLGRSRKTGVETAVLYSILGVSAHRALSEIQEGLRRGMAKQN